MKTDHSGEPARPAPPASLEDDLRALAHPDARDQQFAQRLDQVLEQHYSEGMTPKRNRIVNPTLSATPGRPRPRFNLRLASLAAVVVLVIVGAVAFLIAQSPAPVSAHEILQRAAAGRMPPNQIVHRQYELTQTMGLPAHGTADIWTQSDAQGVVTRSAWTFTGNDDSPDSLQHILINGATAQVYYYNGKTRTATTSTGPASQVMKDGVNVFDGPSLARFFDQITQGGAQGTRVLPPQTLDGVPVVGIQVDDNTNNEHFTVYFDTQYYTLRQGWFTGGHVWITLDQVVAPDSVPADVFAWNPPANATVETPPPGATGADHTAVRLKTLETTCHVPAGARAAAQHAGQQTPLALCQTYTPGMTEDALVTALIAPDQAQWNAGAAEGKINSDQLASLQTEMQMELRIWVTTPLSDK